jgi:periplasmic copper chaperone A
MLASALIATSGRSFAHTDTDVVGVPAGSEATVALRPTHGCGDSPTVTVRIRAPLEGARAVPVDGWQETATSDGAGNTVLEWTGGILPADVTGAFAVSFAAPDDPGRLLVFPAVQRCEDGEELAWINGDPTAQYPAPRVLVLPAGAAAAATIDDVPPDAPGRDQLVTIVDLDGADVAGADVDGADVDNAGVNNAVVDGAAAAGATSTTVAAAPTSAASATTIEVTTTATSEAVTATTSSDAGGTATETTISELSAGDDDGGSDDGGDGGGVLAVALGAAVAAAAVAAIVIARRRRA